MRPNEGDAYPLGALSPGTKVHCIEMYPKSMRHSIRAAGTVGTVLRKFDGHVVVQCPNKREIAFREECMATVGKFTSVNLQYIRSHTVISCISVVGRVSNIEHAKTPIGSPNRNRELGNRPRSGLWQRKTGKHGRKVRRPPPMRIQEAPKSNTRLSIRINPPCATANRQTKKRLVEA